MPWGGCGGQHGGSHFKLGHKLMIIFLKIFLVSLWVCWWLIVVGILIAQISLVLGLRSRLRSLKAIHLVHILVLMLQGDVLALEGVYGL